MHCTHAHRLLSHNIFDASIVPKRRKEQNKKWENRAGIYYCPCPFICKCQHSGKSFYRLFFIYPTRDRRCVDWRSFLCVSVLSPHMLSLPPYFYRQIVMWCDYKRRRIRIIVIHIDFTSPKDMDLFWWLAAKAMRLNFTFFSITFSRWARVIFRLYVDRGAYNRFQMLEQNFMSTNQ